MTWARHLCLCVFVMLCAVPAQANDQQLLAGDAVSLGRLRVDQITLPFSVTVELDGDVPTGTYVTARFQNNTPRQRLASGYWVPWDETLSSLHDNGFPASGDGTLTFDIVDETLSGQFLPIVFTVSYQHEGGLKSGYIVIDR
jgi:hypothetical protein